MWRLETVRGSWHTPQFQFHLDITRPQLGWTRTQISGLPLDDGLFQVQLPGAGGTEAVVDSYVRQADLIVTYAQSPDRTVRPQLVWRALRDGDTRVGAELILSMQTSLLKSEPEIRVGGQLSGELLLVDDLSNTPCEASETRNTPTMLLQRPVSADDWSFVTVVHPTDFQSLTVHRLESMHWRTEFTLFPQSLEKGVIRRGRVRGIFVPRQNDLELARQCQAELADAAPPLTA